jgi:two-component system LytT family sensor kinase
MYFVMERNSEQSLAIQQQQKIQFVQNRLTPYLIIMLFTFAISVVRVFMIPEWPIGRQIFAFFMQTICMIGIWHLVKWLGRSLDKFLPFEKGPFKRIVVQQLLSLAILTPIVIFAVSFSKPYLPTFVNQKFVAVAIVMFIVMVALFNFSFYAAYFFNNWQESVLAKSNLEVQAAELEKERSYLQYHQLRNQVNPHYLFNTLTSLDGLIHSNPDLASEFVRHMAKVYRYVLQHKENEVVNLDEELDFMQHYIQLLEIRYAGSIQIHHNISGAAKDKGVVMVTLQMLVDNAIKHNIIQEQTPLKMIIWDEADYLIVYNNKQLRKQVETSNQVGLRQLKQLYSYLTDKPIVIEDSEDHYTIKIPLL